MSKDSNLHAFKSIPAIPKPSLISKCKKWTMSTSFSITCENNKTRVERNMITVLTVTSIIWIQLHHKYNKPKKCRKLTFLTSSKIHDQSDFFFKFLTCFCWVFNSAFNIERLSPTCNNNKSAENSKEFNDIMISRGQILKTALSRGQVHILTVILTIVTSLSSIRRVIILTELALIILLKPIQCM